MQDGIKGRQRFTMFALLFKYQYPNTFLSFQYCRYVIRLINKV